MTRRQLESHDYEYAQLEELKGAAVLILASLTGLAMLLGLTVWFILRSVALCF